jgi:hypothetical protein
MKKTIKRSLILVLFLLFISTLTNAQSFTESSKVVNAGVGLGYNYYKAYRGSGYKYGSTPVICLSYEQGYPKRVGPGIIGIGGLVTFQNAYSRYDNIYLGSGYKDSYRWSNFVLAARAAYHWDELNTDKYDIYAGVMAGIRVQSYSYSTEYSGPVYVGVNDRSGRSTSFHSVGGLFAGARYYFKPSFGMYGEIHLGASVPYLNIGFSFKF